MLTLNIFSVIKSLFSYAKEKEHAKEKRTEEYLSTSHKTTLSHLKNGGFTCQMCSL